MKEPRGVLRWSPRPSPMTSPQFRRRQKLIKPRIQLQLTLFFVGLAALSLLLEFVLFTNTLTSAALTLPNDGPLLLEQASTLLLTNLVVAFLVFLPLTFTVGVLATFRFAGPLYRFEVFLRQIKRGERPRDFCLRKGDELQEMAALLNDVTRPIRTAPQEAGGASMSVEQVPSLVSDPQLEDEQSVGKETPLQEEGTA